MMAWMRNFATKKPLKSPQAHPVAMPARRAGTKPAPAVYTLPVTLAESAITAPTEMSMPPVAMTSVMPIATSKVGWICKRKLRRVPVSTKCGVKAALTARMKTSIARPP